MTGRQGRDRVAELAARASTDAELAELAAEGLDRVARREVRRRRGVDALLRDAARALLDESGSGGAA
ncbi:hypothetical protein [Saccharothrix syringae]|uniref:Uncharacterized protein n=1 Tax=Saccharothrix syringae TaxID=103733 RepID=A0A5Q0GUJ2_SACSY|nr:hypothetical protein [Saccharothrix syringae]QFZ17563.1 hypothetical protein EKG83_08775 [Saccharothrix syringae]